MRILAKNLLILASAGSGKTYQLGNRVIGLVAGGVDPTEIVALTFTRKAAGEFADSVLTKLAEAAEDESSAGRLRTAIQLPEADFRQTLESVVRSLPRFTLGTMDGFFARIVRGFQMELGLTGGTFELVEGPRAAALADELLAAVLGDALARDQGDEFFHAFRRASIGKEDQGVLKSLRAYITRWQDRFQESADLEWGPARLAPESPDAWAKQKSGMAAAIARDLESIEYTHKSQPDALRKCVGILENHAIGSGSLGGSSIPRLLANILDAVANTSGPLTVKSNKDFVIAGRCAENLRQMVELAAHCELAAALQRTRAVREVVAVFDALCGKRLRTKGLLGFHDVKVLMGRWAHDENARLRREAVDFRLDARIHHWLLDEFQDTSRADWLGLLPLIDEAATGDDGSMFIVGDRKQAIYAWRGGDVGLFDEVIDRYSGGLEIEPMAESWRSCPEVLDLVNRVCGDLATMGDLFGPATGRWKWDCHFPAEPLKSPAKSGESRVEIVGDWEERLERMAVLLKELGVGQRQMTCGVLLRGNEKVRNAADFLRTHGFDVIEEGRRQPSKDNPVGIVITHLLKWLADPSDSFSREVLAMSPMAERLLEKYDGQWWKVWNDLTAQVAHRGFAATLETIIEPLWHSWSDFGKRRAGDLLAALGQIDQQGVISCRAAADWLERMEVSQSPGVAAVQVMTIHKSKGLGFDVVILPEIPDEIVPLTQHFDVAEGPDWITETPPKWVRNIIPEMRQAEARWAEAQRYEAFCTLYVALTRAKRGLYVLLAPPADSADPEKPSLANWMRRSLAAAATPGMAHQSGSPHWMESIPSFESKAAPASLLSPGPGIPQRGRNTPSQAKSGENKPSHSPAGMAFGNEVHALLEKITWMDESLPELPQSQAGLAVSALLKDPALSAGVFSKSHRNIELLREQPMDAIIDGILVSGVIDRLHIHRDPSGKPIKIHIIDFKTDAVKDARDLIPRHANQMTAYQTAMRSIYPDAEVVCSLLSVRHARLVDL